jgi:hypothetical protein
VFALVFRCLEEDRGDLFVALLFRHLGEVCVVRASHALPGKGSREILLGLGAFSAMDENEIRLSYAVRSSKSYIQDIPLLKKGI